MSDPISEFFDLAETRSADVGAPVQDNPAGARPIENEAISQDVALTREALRKAITDAAEKLPTVLELAMQMQDPEMTDSASKMMTALGKISVDLINIDLRVLQESKKITAPVDNPVKGGSGEAAPASAPSSTADIIKAIKALKAAERAKSSSESAETVKAKGE